MRTAINAMLFATLFVLTFALIFLGLSRMTTTLIGALILVELSVTLACIAIAGAVVTGCLWAGRVLWLRITNNSGNIHATDFCTAGYTCHPSDCTCGFTDWLARATAAPIAVGLDAEASGRYHGLDRVSPARMSDGDGEDSADEIRAHNQSFAGKLSDVLGPLTFPDRACGPCQPATFSGQGDAVRDRAV